MRARLETLALAASLFPALCKSYATRPHSGGLPQVGIILARAPREGKLFQLPLQRVPQNLLVGVIINATDAANASLLHVPQRNSQSAKGVAVRDSHCITFIGMALPPPPPVDCLLAPLLNRAKEAESRSGARWLRNQSTCRPSFTIPIRQRL